MNTTIAQMTETTTVPTLGFDELIKGVPILCGAYNRHSPGEEPLATWWWQGHCFVVPLCLPCDQEVYEAKLKYVNKTVSCVKCQGLSSMAVAYRIGPVVQP